MSIFSNYFEGFVAKKLQLKFVITSVYVDMTEIRTKFAKLTELEKEMTADEFQRLKSEVDTEYLVKFKVNHEYIYIEFNSISNNFQI